MPPLNNISRGAAENTEKKELQSSRLCASVRDRLIGCPLGQRALSKQSGFTLMELVLVVVLLGIVAITSTQFVQFGVETYLDGASRQHMASTGRFVTERLSRELRNAVPNSVLVRSDLGDCLEFRPVEVDLGYLDDATPISPESPQNSMQVVLNSDPNLAKWQPDAGEADYVATIYPQRAEDGHTHIGSDRAIGITGFANLNNNAFEITFTGPFAFAEGSPAKRVYISRSVVTYCYEGGQLFRAEDSSPRSSSVNQTNGVLMGQWFNNQAGEAMFAISDSNFSAGALVLLTLRLTERNEEVMLRHEIHLLQAP